jgi:NAD+ synthase (glutamine-hydrolysing)
MISLKITTASINTIALDIAHNVKLIIQAIEQASSEGADILLLPELVISGYGCDDMFLVPEFIDNCWQALKKVIQAIPNNGLVVAIGLPFYINDKLYNTCAVVTHKRILGFSCKQFLAKSGVHYEPRWFEAWSHNHHQAIIKDGYSFPVGQFLYEINAVKLGIEICEDAWVAERPGRFYAENGVDIILNPSASHFAIAKHQKRLALVTHAADSFHCIYAYSNLLGCEAGRTIYDGGNIVAQGNKILSSGKRLSFYALQLEYTTVSFKAKHFNTTACASYAFEIIEFGQQLNQTCNSAEVPLPTEDPLAETLKALALGLWDWQRKTYQKGYVVSLSGGADSALVAASVYLAHQLARMTLGEQVYHQQLQQCGIDIDQDVFSQVLTTVYQASAHSSERTCLAARQLAKGLGAKHHQWDIEPQVAYSQSLIEKSLERSLTWDKDDIALQNIQARVRSPGIWMMANIEGKLLLATSNLSEASVGYCTMDGDTSGVLAPIGGISKSLVLSLNQYLCGHGLMLENGGQLKIPAMADIISQQPTAELRPIEQTDEADLMPFIIMDEIRRLSQVDRLMGNTLVDALSRSAAGQGYDKSTLYQYVNKYFQLYSKNQWKRERLAVSFHIEEDSACAKTYRRYPILNHLSNVNDIG